MPYNDVPDYVIEHDRSVLRGIFPNLRCTYKQAWDFEDYKGWVAYLGEHEEATITWRSVSNELVQSGELEPGYSWMATHDNGSRSMDGITTMHGAMVSLEKYLFSEERQS